ncbi:MAG: replication protein RepA [Candidatus Nanopelagicales bacterium]
MTGQPPLPLVIPDAVLRKVDLAHQIEVEDPRVSGRMSFSPHYFAQISLPYKDPGTVPQWSRKNGKLTLAVTPGIVFDTEGNPSPQYPYGAYPRLLLIWMATKAVQTKNRVLSLGSSQAELMRDLEIPKGGMQRKRLREQINRLVTAQIIVHERKDHGHVHGTKTSSFGFTREVSLWWSDRDDDSPQLMDSTITLSEEFYNSIIEHPVPVDMAALAYLRQQGGTGLPIDIYVWLAYRMSSVHRPTQVTWDQLAAQFGSQYTRARAFKPEFLKALGKVVGPGRAYPKAHVDVTKRGLTLLPSPTPVPRKSVRW